MFPTLSDCFWRTVRLIIALLGTGPVAFVAAQQEATEMYVSDMSRCEPASALSQELARGKWRLISYESEKISGTMVAAASFIDARDIRVPLDAKGWHAIYVGYWNPAFAYDGSPVLKVKLTGDAAFRRIHAGASPDSQHATYLREAYLRIADLTGQDLVVGKANGPLGKSAYLAYARLVPLSEEQVRQIEGERSRTDTRNLVATIDGASYFHYSECTRPEHILEQIELYRFSDVAKVLWAVNYGATTNYPTEVDGAIFLGSDQNRARLVDDGGPNEYVRGEKQTYDSLRAFAAQGVIPQQIAADHAHGMGLKFDIMFRLGILGGVGPLRMSDGNYVRRHPEFRQVLRDGTPVEKASYAFDRVQDLMLGLLAEATRKIDADGVNLCFVRGPHFVLYEQPVLDAFRSKYGRDAREVNPNDPRLLEVQAGFMTRFVQNARAVLDQVGREKNRRLELSVWVWPSNQNVWLGNTPVQEGLDVKRWISEGLLDSVICQEGVDAEYMKLCQAAGCRFILYTGYRGDKAMSPETVTKAYEAGVNAFAYWDIDAAQLFPDAWNWLRRVGHRDEMADWKRFDPGSRLIKLKTVAGANVDKGLPDAVYSGG